MRLFVTGASGFIGSAVVPELLAAGHHVVGMARSDAAAERVAAMGAEVLRGDLRDLDSLRAGARASEGVIHLGFIHDFANFGESVAVDRAAIETLGTALEGTQHPLLIASGVFGLTPGRPVTESDLQPADPDAGVSPRHASAQLALSFVPRGVRTVIVRFAPTVHGAGDRGFVPAIISIARERGVSGYIGAGENRWAAVHRQDAARLVRLATESAAAGTAVHAIAEEGIATREIAEAIGRHLGIPAVSVAPDHAGEHFGWIGMFFGGDCSASSAITRQSLGWNPSHPGLIDDLTASGYFETAAV